MLFIYVQNLPAEPRNILDEDPIETHFKTTTRRNSHDRYIVRMPLKIFFPREILNRKRFLV